MKMQNAMPSALSNLVNFAPYHLLSYGTLLGTTLYQTFIMTKVSYRALPITAFTTLQKRVFPVYFRSQSILLLATAVTSPPLGPLSLFKNKSDWLPLALASIMAGLNLFVYGPQAQKAMVDRIHQETKDGRKFNDLNITVEMRAKKSAFSRAHAMSIHINFVAIVAIVWYGIHLASQLDVKKQ